MKVLGSIFPLIRIGELFTCIWFGIVANVAVNVLLGATCINKSIKEILFMERQVGPINSLTVAMLASKPTPPPILASVRTDRE